MICQKVGPTVTVPVPTINQQGISFSIFTIFPFDKPKFPRYPQFSEHFTLALSKRFSTSETRAPIIPIDSPKIFLYLWPNDRNVFAKIRELQSKPIKFPKSNIQRHFKFPKKQTKCKLSITQNASFGFGFEFDFSTCKSNVANEQSFCLLSAERSTRS